jgi:hypothetical protein
VKRFLAIIKSKTVWGALLGAGSWLASQDHVGVVQVIQAGGTVLSAIGLRDSVTKTIEAVKDPAKPQSDYEYK